MTSRIAVITFLTAALSASALMATETNPSPHRQAARVNFVDRLSAKLNLTDQQKQQAKAIARHHYTYPRYNYKQHSNMRHTLQTGGIKETPYPPGHLLHALRQY